MDPSTQTRPPQQTSGISEDSNPSHSISNSSDVTSGLPPKDPTVMYHTKNLYPTVRHTILILLVIFCISLIIFLMHQNGKSIYDNGI